MYIYLLSLRYLRSRYIAPASIISVTLGVATLIVVNSVMNGFSTEMRADLHNILSDVEVASPGVGEILYPEEHKRRIREVCGDDLDALTEIVRVPALLHFDWRGRMISQQILLIGIDDETYASVSDFRPYLQNEHLRKDLSFELQTDGYEERIGDAGWDYRRQKVAAQQNYERMLQETYPARKIPAEEPTKKKSGKVAFHALPAQQPELSPERMVKRPDNQQNEKSAIEQLTEADVLQMPSPVDSHAAVRPPEENLFDPMVKQHTGIILGIAISNRKVKDPETGEVTDAFLCRPGDDVQISFPTVGSPPKPVSDICTIVDFYESKMHEYDANFAFMPLSALQKARHMVSPNGEATVSAIQIKLKAGADLDVVRDKLLKEFPPTQYAYNIQTWEDTQRPLLSAARMELTILNILLFMIIAVAGFGILATFFMIVVEKTKDIGVLKSLGASSSGVMSIFLGYGLTLGMVGSGVGILGGLLFVHYINDIADLIGKLSGHDVFDPTIYYFDKIPTIIEPSMVMWVAIGATLIAVGASILPAVRAARLHPVEALRYE